MSTLTHYKEAIQEFHEVYNRDPVLQPIVNAITTYAFEVAYNASMTGGAAADYLLADRMISELKMFLQGVLFGRTEDTECLGQYKQIYLQSSRENDPQYKEYLRLKEFYKE